MANMNCNACDELRQVSPELIVNGFNDEMCTSLENDTGLTPDSGNNDCTDLHNMNDCLVGNMETEIEAYDICDWKTFMKRFIPNVWTTLKAMICAICGIWVNIHQLWDKVNCLINSVKTLINLLNQSTQGTSFIRFYRDNSGTGSGYEWDINDGASHTLNIFMDADVDYPGSQVADRDYVVLVQNCTDIHGTANCKIRLTYFSSGDTRPMDLIRRRQSQHPAIDLGGARVDNFSWTNSGAVLIRRGEFLKVNAQVHSGNTGYFRLHQFIITWIPVNLGSSPLDPEAIVPC